MGFRIVWFHDSQDNLCGALVSDSDQYQGVLDPIVEVPLAELMASDPLGAVH